jgi:hypothetical protein
LAARGIIRVMGKKQADLPLTSGLQASSPDGRNHRGCVGEASGLTDAHLALFSGVREDHIAIHAVC